MSFVESKTRQEKVGREQDGEGEREGRAEQLASSLGGVGVGLHVAMKVA